MYWHLRKQIGVIAYPMYYHLRRFPASQENKYRDKNLKIFSKPSPASQLVSTCLLANAVKTHLMTID